MSIAIGTESETGLRLKGSMLPCTVLELTDFDADGIARQLGQQVAEAPAFFANMPFVLSLEQFLPGPAAFPVVRFLQVCRDIGIHVVGIRQAGAEVDALARQAGLAVLPAGISRTRPAEPAPAEPAVREPAAAAAARIIRQPVRSGQQVCAPDGDLIVTAPVSAGAEILAAGNIHVYAPLRGRALAGIRGDENVQIFCQSLEAELVSIAGRYRICEQTADAGWKQSVQIQLSDEALQIRSLQAGRDSGVR